MYVMTDAYGSLRCSAIFSASLGTSMRNLNKLAPFSFMEKIEKDKFFKNNSCNYSLVFLGCFYQIHG